MKNKILNILFLFLLFQTIISTTHIPITITEEEQKFDSTGESENTYFNISLSSTIEESYKFTKIIIQSENDISQMLYSSLRNETPSPLSFDLSSNKENILYIPKTYFSSQKYFYLNLYNKDLINFTLIFQQVEMMECERSKRLDFLTFDYEDYLIKFEKSENIKNSQLMVTASGGGKGHHGSKNNVKLNLYYHDLEKNFNLPIQVNSETMFNGAGTTFIESKYINNTESKGYYLAKIRGPQNTYINFMVRKIGVSCDLPINTKAIYGFLQNDNIDTFELTNHGIPIIEEEDEDYEILNNEIPEKIFQISILVKGDLQISKSTVEVCDIEEETFFYDIKDELQLILTFTSEEISKGYTHICIQGKNIGVDSNAYILEVYDVTDQTYSTIVNEPLVNGFLYSDLLKKNEVRNYRPSKFIGEGYTKYNVKQNEGIIKVALVNCKNFPNCFFDKNIFDENVYLLSSVDNYFTTNVKKNITRNAYSPEQDLLTVLCITEKCKYEVSFSDEEDSLILREDSRIAHYISSTSQNYYHFRITNLDDAKKIIINLRTFSGDSNMVVYGDCNAQKNFLVENSEIFEFYDDKFYGDYNLNITAFNINSFYLLSYSIIRKDENYTDKIFDIGFGVSVLEYIKPNEYTQKKFKFFHDKTKGDNLLYVTNYLPINCEIKVSFFDENILEIDERFQHEILLNNSHYNEDNFIYNIEFISFHDNGLYDDKLCMFYIYSQEISEKSETIIGEGASLGITLNSNIQNYTFLYPNSAGASDILIKYNLENNYPIQMEININKNFYKKLNISRSSSHVIPNKYLKEYCPTNLVCVIRITFSEKKNLLIDKNLNIPINFIIKSKDNVPSYLWKNYLYSDLVAKNSIQYYLVDLSPLDKGEIVINFKKGSGKIFAKMLPKNYEAEKDADWNNKIKLPQPDDTPINIESFNFYKQKISYDTKNLCPNGCDLYIGVISTDEIKDQENIIDYSEYTIYIRPEINDIKLIDFVSVDISSNEYITGFIDNINITHYFDFYVKEDCDFIEIEFQSEACTMYVNEGDEFPNINNKNAQWKIYSPLNDIIYKINKNEIKVDTLKDKKFKIAINLNNEENQNLQTFYIFRIKTSKKTMKNISEINCNIDTTCNITEINGYCDLVYPLSDYEYESGSSLIIYAESEVISDIEIFYNTIDSDIFDGLSENEINNLLPREYTNKNSSQNQNIKNILEITNSELKNKIKPFILISIRSSVPGILNIYTSMRDQVLSTTINPFSYFLFNRQKDPIKINIKGDEIYTYRIVCIEGSGEAYFESQKDILKKTIYGGGAVISMTLPEKKDDCLIIEPNENGIIFYIDEDISIIDRKMDKIKYGFSGKLSYENLKNRELPIIYYMKIQNETESINVNVRLNNISNINNSNIFEIKGYIVNENTIISMEKNNKEFPTISSINGTYDSSLMTAKLYITETNISQSGINDIKYLIISLDKSKKNKNDINGLLVEISIMPFSNILYNSPYNLYIYANLLKDEKSQKCNYHRLRAGNLEDKYMQVEYAKFSDFINLNIIDLNGNKINFITQNHYQFGKNISVFEINPNDDIVLEACKINNIAHDSTSNYVFKIQSNKTNNFDNMNSYFVESEEIKYNFINHNSKIILNIPKILNYEKTKIIPAKYYIRLYSKNYFKQEKIIDSISFNSYEPYEIYVYEINETNYNKEDEYLEINIENISIKEEFVLSVLAVDSIYGEIFAFKNIFSKENDKTDSESYLWIIILVVLIVIILLGIAVVFIIKIVQKKKESSANDEIDKLQGGGKNALIGEMEEES